MGGRTGTMGAVRLLRHRPPGPQTQWPRPSAVLLHALIFPSIVAAVAGGGLCSPNGIPGVSTHPLASQDPPNRGPGA